MSSILTDVKTYLGISSEDTHFDQDVIMHINSAISKLNQVCIGESIPFSITDDTSEWDEIIDERYVTSVKPYVYIQTRIGFDPPLNATILSTLKEERAEFEWRIKTMVEENE